MQAAQRVMLVLSMMAAAVQGAETMQEDMRPEAVVGGFEQRVDAVFRAEAGKPLVREPKRPPLSHGRGNYVRGYSYSIMAFATRCLYLNEMLDEANAALAENAQYYLDHASAICDRDSFHWHADTVMRLLEMYGTHGTAHPGRITPQTEALLLKPIWLYAKACSWLKKTEYQTSKTWHNYSSENHDAMDFVLCWQFAKLVKDLPEYRDLQYDEGGTPAEHFAAWNKYVVVYCLERARKGVCTEIMNTGYNSTWAKTFYNLYDFGDPQVSAAAGKLLDMFFAYWAQEQIDGVSGGGKTRIYFENSMRSNRSHGMGALAWYYFGIGPQPRLNGHDVNALLSAYRPPAVVADIALDVEGRGRYVVRQRAQGLGKQGHTFPKMDRPDMPPNKLSADGGGIIRYTYCDPAFIMGTLMTEARPMLDWVYISVQNRWQGVIFPGDHDARIMPLPRPANNRVSMNGFWSVQEKGCLMTQKLKTHKGAAEMIVWMSPEGLSTPVEEEGIVFTEAEGAYAAVRVVSGGFTWHKEGSFTTRKATGNVVSTPPGRIMMLNNEFAPVIVEVMAKTDIADFDAFKARVKACEMGFDGPALTYRTVYGDTLTLDTSYEAAPSVNGKSVDYAPKWLYESPFLNADYNTGIVTITKGDRKTVLNFNVPE